MRFASPWFLLLLLLLPLWLRHYRESLRRSRANVRFPDTGMVTRLKKYKRPAAAHAPFALRFVAVALIILALARPQTGYREEEIVSKGIDIMLTLDLSSSMTASDLQPTRLAAAKKVLAEFINGRVNDRIGLVVFAAEGYTRCPLTLDYAALLRLLEASDIGLIDDGTAIGMAIATATNRLKDLPSETKVMVLLTDGVNNRGAIDPITAAKLAEAVGVKIYAIGVGREGAFLQTVDDPLYGKRRVPVRTEIDEQLLRRIAASTGGKYYRAQSEQTLLSVYKEIDRLEKTDIRTKIYTRHTDWFMWLAVPALLLILAELVLPVTRWRTVP